MPAKKPKGKPERLSGIESDKDREEAFVAITRAFTNLAWWEREMMRSRWAGSLGDPEHTRIVVADGRVVSAAVMAPRVLRFGPARVPAMTIGPVGTDDRCRKRGYAAMAMDDATRYMVEHGYPTAYLQGIGDFYHRFGYYPFMAPMELRIERKRAEKEGRPGRLRAMTRKDLPRVRKVYAAAAGDRLCSSDRDAETWEWLLAHGGSELFPSPKVILDGRKRIRGYVTTRKGRHFMIRELAVEPDEQAYRVALTALAREARRTEDGQVRMHLPWDDGFCVFARQLTGAQFKAWSNATGGMLLKVVDFPVLMRALAPLFTARLEKSRARLSGTAFNLKSEIGEVGVRVGRSAVRIGDAGEGECVVVPQRWLSGLLTGYYTPAEIAPRDKARLPEALLPALDTLFPRQWPHVYGGDNY